MRRVSVVAGLLAMAFLPLVLGISGGSPSSLAYRFTRQSTPHVQTVVGWMVGSSAGKALEAARGAAVTRQEAMAYFDLAGQSSRLRNAMWKPTPTDPAAVRALAAELAPVGPDLDLLRPAVEQLIQRQVTEALIEDGVGLRVPGLNLVPPVLFRFEVLPNLLVVSPRDRIERSATVLLRPKLTLREADELESALSGQGFSVLATPIGGLGVYPSMVPESEDIRWTLRTVAHEWAHQFYALRPLGWRYAFGAETDSRMVTINETAAEVVGREIGDKVYGRTYRDVDLERPRSPALGYSYQKSMRDIRARVDALLSDGLVDEAEAFMEEARQQLAAKGYYIRKLNQAYFAFYGSYADQPYLAGPQGEDIAGLIRAIRERSDSLGDFAWTISSVGSYDEFRRLAESR